MVARMGGFLQELRRVLPRMISSLSGCLEKCDPQPLSHELVNKQSDLSVQAFTSNDCSTNSLQVHALHKKMNKTGRRPV